MTKTPRYVYLGESGLVYTPIYIPGVSHVLEYYLKAEPGKILTNGSILVYSRIVTERDLPNWYEIDDGQE